MQDALVLAKLGNWTRLVAVVGKTNIIEVWLIDVDFNGIIRKSSAPLGDANAVGRAVQMLFLEPSSDRNAISMVFVRPWYKDWVAWTMAGAGAAMLAAGFSLNQVYGTPSKTEQLAYALLALGGGTMGTGIALFFTPTFSKSPANESSGKNTAVGFAAGAAF